MPRDFDAEHADTIQKNRALAPTTVALADTLFDLALASDSSALQTLAIEVDAKAQMGDECRPKDVAHVYTRANEILGLPTTCQEPISDNSLCSLLNVPGTDRCPIHQKEN